MESAIERYRELDDPYYEGMMAGLLGEVSMMEADWAGLVKWSTAWIRVSQELGDTPTLMRNLFAAVGIAMRVGMPEAAVTLYAAHTGLSRRFGIVATSWTANDPLWTGDPVDDLRQTLDPPAFDRAWRRGESMSLDDAVSFLLATASSIAETPTGPSSEEPPR
jgi:hypothetical protein